MKSLVFPIIGSLVIGGGAITAPIYAPFIEKAIEDNKEPGPIPPGPTKLNHEWKNESGSVTYLYSDPVTLAKGDEISFITSFDLWTGLTTNVSLWMDFCYLDASGEPHISFLDFTVKELYVDGDLIPPGPDTWMSHVNSTTINDLLAKQMFDNKSLVSGTIVADEEINNQHICFDDDI